MSVEIRHISNHGKTTHGTPHPDSGYARKKQEGWGQYVVIYGKGSKRKSITVHGSKEHVDYIADNYKGA